MHLYVPMCNVAYKHNSRVFTNYVVHTMLQSACIKFSVTSFMERMQKYFLLTLESGSDEISNFLRWGRLKLPPPPAEVQLGPSDSVSTVMEGDDAMVCIQVSSNGSLQRDIQVAVKTISTQTSTGKQSVKLTSCRMAWMYTTERCLVSWITYRISLRKGRKPEWSNSTMDAEIKWTKNQAPYSTKLLRFSKMWLFCCSWLHFKHVFKIEGGRGAK